MKLKTEKTSKNLDFSKRLKSLFEGKSYLEIGQLLNLSDATISNYLNGRIPSADKLIRISEITDCNLHWLLTGRGEKILKPVNKPTTLVFYDIGNVLEITISAALIAILLSRKGKKVLFIDDKLTYSLNLFYPTTDVKLNKEEISKNSEILRQNIPFCIESILGNVDILMPFGTFFIDYKDYKLTAFDGSHEAICQKYDFIIMCSKYTFSSDKNSDLHVLSKFYNNSKIIISVNPSVRNPVESIKREINKIEQSKEIYSETEIIGIMINCNEILIFHDQAERTKQKIPSVQNKIKDVYAELLFDTVIDKMFTYPIKETENINKFYKIHEDILKIYQKLLTEIEEKLSK